MRLPELFTSRGTLVIAFLGALLVIAVVLQAAESMWHTVSPPEEYTPPPPTTDPDEIRAFIETARPKLEVQVEDRRIRVGNAPGGSFIHFDGEAEALEGIRVCLEEGHAREMERLLEETTEIPGGRFARARFREEIQQGFRGVFHQCLEETLGVPAVPSLPELSAHQHPHD